MTVKRHTDRCVCVPVFVCSILCVWINIRSTFLYSVSWYFCIHSAICDCFLIYSEEKLVYTFNEREIQMLFDKLEKILWS